MGRITRRKVLGGSVAAAGAIAATLMPIGTLPRAAAVETRKKRQWAMVNDMRRCDGCKKCIEACQTTHHLPKTTEWLTVNEIVTTVRKRYFMPLPCMQCENAPCLRACPVGATFRDGEGVILIDQDRCIYLGYVCGFNSAGDIDMTLPISGEKGWHFIDMYPGIYKGKETQPVNYRMPQLSFEKDHPGEDLPAFHFAFYIE